MRKKVVVLQSNYLPWKGYFDLIKSADVLCFYDDVQFTKSDWRNRNLIKTPQGLGWLTVPVGQNINRRIDEVLISDCSWQKKHHKAIKINYSKAKYASEFDGFLEDLYLRKNWANLSDLNQWSILEMCKILNINSFDLLYSKNFTLEGAGESRLLNLLKQVGASTYLTGPNGLNYLSPSQFKKNSIRLEIIDYSRYSEYLQPHPPFTHSVSMIDTLLCCGSKDASSMLDGVSIPASEY